MSGSPADVNGDGTPEHFWTAPVNLLQDSSAYPLYALSRSRIDQLNGVTTERLDRVLRVGMEFVSAEIPGNASQASLSSFVWRDMELDGDCDLLVEIRWKDATGWHYKRGWFENIGYEKPAPPIAADLKRDGTVDGFDRALLLNSWGAGA